MPNKKIYIALFVFMIVFGIIMFVLWGIPNIRQNNLEATLVVGDHTTWVYQDKKWLFMRSNTSMEQYNWSMFHVLEDNKELGDYYLWHDDKWYVFDQNKKAVNLSGKMIAYLSDYEMKVDDFQEVNIDDYTYVHKVLEENRISTNSQFTSAYKVLLDFDHDSREEEFYIISNAFPLDFDPNMIFSIAFMVKDDQIYTFYNDISYYEGLNGCKPYYHTFIDTNSDGIDEVILSCGKYGADEQTDMLFQFVDDNFKLLISNQ